MLLAKIAVPRRVATIARPRLAAALAGSGAPVVWIGAPPGSGKTLFASACVRDLPAKRRVAWLHVDAEDTDPTVLFHYLALAVAAADKRRKPKLPVADPAQRGRYATFARRFARQMFEALGDGGVLVMDNVHELAGAENAARLDLLLAAIAEEVPEGSRLLLLSHSAPPTSFAPLAASRRLLVFDGDALRLDAAETAALHQSLGARGGWSHEQLQSMTQGWAAGVVLLANVSAERGAQGAGQDTGTLFDYFASVAVDRLPARCVEILLRTAMLHEPTAAAIDALTGGSDAAHWLDHAQARGLFVERHTGGTQRGMGHAVYTMHGLFRSFLRDYARRHIEPAALSDLLAAVARSEAANGHVENAVRLFLQTGGNSEAAELLLASAPALVREGRLALLLELIEALGAPDAKAPGAPEILHSAWMQYWKGIALSHVNEARARESLSAAFSLHERGNHRLGQLLAAAAIADFTVQHFASFHDIERWQAVLNDLYSPGLAFGDAEQELRALTGVLAANLLFTAEVERLEPLIRRCEVLVAQGGLDANQRLAAASFVLTCFDQMPGQYARALEFIHLAAQVAKEPLVTDLRRATWLHWLASFHSQAFKVHLRGPEALKACHRCLAELQALGDANDFQESRFTAMWLTADLEMFAGDLAGAEARLEAAESLVTPAQPVLATHYFMTRSHLAIYRGDARKALALARHGIEIAENAGMPETVISKVRYTEAQICVPLGMFAEARAATERVIAVARPAYVELYRTGLLGIRALEALSRGGDENPGLDDLLRAFFAWLREDNRIGILQLISGEVAKLCAVALERGIETEHVTRMVRERGLDAPPDAPRNWPWQVALRTLGGFELTLGGEPLRQDGKPQRKPLDLLKALAAREAEAYSGVNAASLAEELWPDLGVEDNRASLHTTLHRARKLLGNDRAIVHADGRVAFDRRVVWCDTVALRDCARRIAELPVDTPSAGSPARALAHELLSLARGPFLEGEDGRWALIARERLNAVFVAAVQRCGAALEAAGAHDDALALYEQGLRDNPLIEALYRAQMRVLLARGERAAALVAYRRCREALSIVLGIAPAAETETLHRQALA